MNQEINVVFDKRESVYASVTKDAMTFAFIALCVWVSRDSAWWTFFTGCAALFWFTVKLKLIAKERTVVLKGKEAAVKWANSLED